MLARRFLYVIAGAIVLVLAVALGWNMWWDRLLTMPFVPTVPYAAPAAATAPDYARADAWLARPDLPADPSRYVPTGFHRDPHPPVAVFYLSPTTYLGRDRWNGPLDDAAANTRLRLFASSQASAFNGIGAIWAPRYRQASIGAFLAEGDDAARALDFAYADVARAFDAFLAQVPADRPILLAGHSQGALHLLRLMKEKVAGRPVARRIVAAYLVGWPVSIEADIPALGLPACAAAGQAGCVLAWQSFADPMDTRLIDRHMAGTAGLTGAPRRGTHMLCTNPLTGVPDTAAPGSADKGALVPRAGLQGADLEVGTIAARCDAHGVLVVAAPPTGYGAYVLPGNNYHVFDYALFWASIRADAEARTATFLGAAKGA